MASEKRAITGSNSVAVAPRKSGPGGPLLVHIGLGPNRVQVGKAILDVWEESYQRRLQKALGTPPQLWFKRICTADDFKAYAPLVGHSFNSLIRA